MAFLSRSPTGGEFVARFLDAAGIDTLFSLPGSQVLPIWDGLSERVRLVVPRSERAGAFMAEGFARASGGPAVIMNTLGPGVANELVGFASARASQAPVVSICPFQPQAKRERMAEVFQGLDSPQFFAAFSKWTKVVDSEAELGGALADALREALSPPPGPVRVEISFPILFARASFGGHTAAARFEPPGAGSICVLETAIGEPPPDLGAATRLAPGIGEAGNAIPFALGAKLARRQQPVVVVSEVRFLLQHMDSLALAASHGIAVRLVGSKAGVLEQVARAFSLELQEPGEGAAWTRPSQGDRELVVVCSG
jgi:thiamine pyrophosphate-dependent acetolactate synthase large subunit-like protein